MRDNLSFYTLTERIFIVKTFYRNESDLSNVKSNFLAEFSIIDDEIPDHHIIEVINLFEETGSVREIPEFYLEDKKAIEDVSVPEIKLEEAEIKTECPTFDTPAVEDGQDRAEPEPKRRTRQSNHIKERKKDVCKGVRAEETEGRIAFECDICKKKFISKLGMKIHVRRHGGTEEYSCKYCQGKTLTSRELKRHVKEQHAEEASRDKPQKTCTICSKTFTTCKGLTQHMLTHSDKRTAVCDVCGAAFKARYTLTVHMRKHTGVKPYKCDFPGCSREFHQSASYRIHRRSHTGEKPYPCKYCGKCFGDKGSLRIHFRQHTGENPFKCELCGKTTKQKQNLKSHMKHFHHINNFTM